MASELNSAISGPMDSCGYKPMSGVVINRVSVQPENRTTVELLQGNICDIYFSLPSRPDSFLNGSGSYLSFTYSFDGTTPEAAKFASISNGNPASFFQTLETTCNATQIELIQDYGVLAGLVDDFQMKDRSTTLCTILQDKSTTDVKRGFQRNINAAGADAFTQDRRVCIPLLSLAVGTLQEKYLPMGRDIGLRLRLTCQDPLLAMVSDQVAALSVLGYKLKDITYECEYLTVPSNIYNSILSEADGVWKVSGTGISSFGVTSAVGATAQTILIPARYSSVRNFFTFLRTSGNLISKAANGVGSRARDNINSYVYRICGQNFPQLPVSCDAFTSAECLTEVIKCFHSHANLSSSVVFNREAFVENVGTVNQGAFVMGIEFEEAGFGGANGQMSGKNTTSGNTFLDITHSAVSTSCVITTFAFYDCIIEITANGEVMVSK